MTRAQLTLLSVLSALSTIAVLAGGAFSSDNTASLVNAAVRGPVTVTAAVPAATEPQDAGVTGAEAPADDSATDVEPVADTSDVSDESTTDTTSDTTTDTSDTDTPEDTTTTPDPTTPKPSQIKHVFQITLAGHGFDTAFSTTSGTPYLAQQLRPQGALLTNYSSLGSAGLPDRLAMIGGQPPNADTRAECPTFTEIPPATKLSKSGEITVAGCVFPNTLLTIGDQLTASGRTWRAYVEDLDKGTPPKASCRRPGSNAVDDTTRARPGDGYATRNNPFVYYHSLLDLGDCDANDGPLARLDQDLQAVKTTPNYSYIAPNLCNDGSESPCVDGSAGGPAAADAFLATWVPKILASPAYRDDGLLIVTFAGSAAPAAADPNAPVRNGTLLVSRFAQAGSVNEARYNPYSLLRSVQDLFALKPIAGSAKATSFTGTVLASARLAQPGDD